MRLFHFYRVEDHSGVSGTGAVVEGVQFTNGWCVLRWISGNSSICFYRSIEDVKAIHGHGGKTEIVVHDFEPLGNGRRKRLESRLAQVETERFDLLMEIIDTAAGLSNLDQERPGKPSLACKRAMSELRKSVSKLEKSLGLSPDAKDDFSRSA